MNALNTIGRGGIAWRRVGLFYGVAFFGALLCTGIIALAGQNLRSSLFALIVAALMMFWPLVAGIITERVAGRPLRVAREWSLVKAHWRRLLLVGSLLPLLILGVDVLVQALVGGILHLPGAGGFAIGQDEVRSSVAAVTGVTPPPDSPLWIIFVAGPIQAILAGFTINGLFAFGEEYGWRGVLADELKPLGPLRANLLTGVLWGLWHAPIIILGHNYGREWGWGIPMMAVLCLPLAGLLFQAREYSGGAITAPAIVHGAFNGYAGILVILAFGASPLIGVPTGLAGAFGLALVWLMAGRLFPTRAADFREINLVLEEQK